MRVRYSLLIINLLCTVLSVAQDDREVLYDKVERSLIYEKRESVPAETATPATGGDQGPERSSIQPQRQTSGKKEPVRKLYKPYEYDPYLGEENVEPADFESDRRHKEGSWEKRIREIKRKKRQEVREKQDRLKKLWRKEQKHTDFEEKEKKEPEENGESSAQTTRIIATIGIVLLVLLAGYLIYVFLSRRNRDSQVKVVNTFSEHQDPGEIPLTELEMALESALKEGNYRAAIRVYFLFILKDLSEKNWIVWKKDKTNMSYLREMSGRPEFGDFNTTVTYYEVVWYGRKGITGEEFAYVEPQFRKLLNTLGVR